MERHQVASEDAGARLDHWLAMRFPDHSRARWQELIRAGHVHVDGKPCKPHRLLHSSDTVAFDIPPPSPTKLIAEPMDLDILFEDADLIVVNKPPGLVVHPAVGHATGTLVNGLLHHCRDLAGVGGERRPGIVHRLDKDTSGVLVVAKHEPAMRDLARQFKQRRVAKEYLALVWGRPEPPTDTITSLIGRSTHDRKKMSATPPVGRRAVSHYETVECLAGATLIRLHIETGRTHQIRVHMAHRGYPVIGDRQYGGRRQAQVPADVERQMLHARRLAFTHPGSGEPVEFQAPIPEDMQRVLIALRAASDA